MPPKKTESHAPASGGQEGKLEKAEQRLEKEGEITEKDDKEEGKDDTDVEFEEGEGREDELEKLEHKLEEEGVDHEKEAEEEEADDAEGVPEEAEGETTQGKGGKQKGEKKARGPRLAKGGTKSGATPRKAPTPRTRKTKQAAPAPETAGEQRESEGEVARSSQEEEGKGAGTRATRKRGAAKTEGSPGKKPKPEAAGKSPLSTPKKVPARGRGISSAAARTPSAGSRAASWSNKDTRNLMEIMIPKGLGNASERPADWNDVAQRFSGRTVEGLRQKWTSLRKHILDHFGNATETEE